MDKKELIKQINSLEGPTKECKKLARDLIKHLVDVERYLPLPVGLELTEYRGIRFKFIYGGSISINKYLNSSAYNYSIAFAGNNGRAFGVCENVNKALFDFYGYFRYYRDN